LLNGGGTFIGLAKELKNKNAGKLYLAVSHGIFSKGFEELKCFERIFTTDSVREIESEEVEQVKLKF
jgi:ribose-phosphate pyrophosphokinase